MLGTICKNNVSNSDPLHTDFKEFISVGGS